jgi:hypothetical protein
MTDPHYSNREIDILFKEIKESLERIESQTTKTNGRVTSLENWKWYITGLVSLLVMLKLPEIVKVLIQ